MTRIIKVLEPFQSYDFGNGIPIIYNVPTEVTDFQLDQIGTLIADMKPKLRPQIVEIVGPAEEPPPETTFATRQWVEDLVDQITGGGIIPIRFRQSTPAAQWIINHTRDTKPDVVLLSDDDGTERVYTDVFYPDDATVIVEWPAPTAGWAYIQ